MKYTRLSLTINGVERFVVCNPETDNLTTVLRRMGLTGTKMGCGTGVCGACSVILNGKVVRSCARKMKSIPEFSEIITIEGIGTPQHLHPLQQAWITYGGVPQIDAIPDDLNLIFSETPRAAGPHGSCGCSEVFQSSNHMAVINAINNACGVRIYSLPATPDKVKAGLEAKQRGEDLTPPKYFLGSDFEEELEYVKAHPLTGVQTAGH